MTLREHIRNLLRASLTLSVSLAALIAVIVVAASGMEFRVDLEVERRDAIWILLVLPLCSLAVTGLLSPLSFLFDRLLFRTRVPKTERETG